MRKTNRILASLSALVALPILTLAPVASAAVSTVAITGNTASGFNQPGWLFNRDATTSTPFEFNTAAHSIGVGSLYVKPIANNYDGSSGTCKNGVDQTGCNKFIAEEFVLAKVADVNSIAYDFKIGAGGTAASAGHFYMNVYANFGASDPLKYYDCKYDVVPTVGSTAGFTTVSFDPTQTYLVTTRGGASASPFTCPASPAGMNGLSANSTIRALSLNVGDTSNSDQGLDGYLDKVVVNTDANVTTYDFEPALTPEAKAACKKGGWKSFNTPVFKNQGQCVKFVVSHGKNKGGNSVINFLKHLL